MVEVVLFCIKYNSKHREKNSEVALKQQTWCFSWVASASVTKLKKNVQNILKLR